MERRGLRSSCPPLVYGLLALHSLVQLISIYNWLRVATTVMTVLAAWQLRRKQPTCRARL